MGLKKNKCTQQDSQIHWKSHLFLPFFSLFVRMNKMHVLTGGPPCPGGPRGPASPWNNSHLASQHPVYSSMHVESCFSSTHPCPRHHPGQTCRLLVEPGSYLWHELSLCHRQRQVQNFLSCFLLLRWETLSLVTTHPRWGRLPWGSWLSWVSWDTWLSVKTWGSHEALQDEIKSMRKVCVQTTHVTHLANDELDDTTGLETIFKDDDLVQPINS